MLQGAVACCRTRRRYIVIYSRGREKGHLQFETRRELVYLTLFPSVRSFDELLRCCPAIGRNDQRAVWSSLKWRAKSNAYKCHTYDNSYNKGNKCHATPLPHADLSIVQPFPAPASPTSGSWHQPISSCSTSDLTSLFIHNPKSTSEVICPSVIILLTGVGPRPGLMS